MDLKPKNETINAIETSPDLAATNIRSPASTEPDVNDCCQICQCKVYQPRSGEPAEPWAFLPCGHKFGYSCIRTWLATTDNPDCPLCRRRMRMSECIHPYEPHPQLQSPVGRGSSSPLPMVRVKSHSGNAASSTPSKGKKEKIRHPSRPKRLPSGSEVAFRTWNEKTYRRALKGCCRWCRSTAAYAFVLQGSALAVLYQQGPAIFQGHLMASELTEETYNQRMKVLDEQRQQAWQAWWDTLETEGLPEGVMEPEKVKEASARVAAVISGRT